MNSECIICFETVRSTESQKPFATRCGHIFHENCINNCLDNQSKCPQCNQPILRSQLVRLFINEPENSVEAKDDLIERLKSQLIELNEKAQLQYDLIGSLNRHINTLEGDKSQSKMEIGGPQATILASASRKFHVPRIHPAKLKINNNLGKSQPTFSFSSLNAAHNNSTASTQVPAGASNLFGNGCDKANNPPFTFGSKLLSEKEILVTNATASSVPLTKFESIPVDAKRDLYEEIGRLIFGETKKFVPSKPVVSTSVSTEFVNLRDVLGANGVFMTRTSHAKNGESSSKSQLGQQSDSTNAGAPIRVLGATRFGTNDTFGINSDKTNLTDVSKSSFGATSKFDWNNKPTSASQLSNTSSSDWNRHFLRDQSKNLFAAEKSNVTQKSDWKPKVTTFTTVSSSNSNNIFGSDQSVNLFAPEKSNLTSRPVDESKMTTSTTASTVSFDVAPKVSSELFGNWRETIKAPPVLDESLMSFSPTPLNLNQFFSKMPKATVLSGSAATIKEEPLVENITINDPIPSDSSNDVVEDMCAETN